MQLFRRLQAGRTAVRVLFVLEDLRIGGAQKHTLELARSLGATHAVELIAISDLDDRLSPDAGAAGVRALGRRGLRPRTWAHLARRIVGFAPNLVVSVNQVATLAVTAARLTHRLRARHAVIFHSCVIDSLAGGLRTAPFIPAVRSADALVYVSANQRRAWERWGLRARRHADDPQRHRPGPLPGPSARCSGDRPRRRSAMRPAAT